MSTSHTDADKHWQDKEGNLYHDDEITFLSGSEKVQGGFVVKHPTKPVEEWIRVWTKTIPVKFV